MCSDVLSAASQRCIVRTASNLAKKLIVVKTSRVRPAAEQRAASGLLLDWFYQMLPGRAAEPLPGGHRDPFDGNSQPNEPCHGAYD